MHKQGLGIDQRWIDLTKKGLELHEANGESSSWPAEMASFFETPEEANAFLARRTKYLLKICNDVCVSGERVTKDDWGLVMFHIHVLEQDISQSYR